MQARIYKLRTAGIMGRTVEVSLPKPVIAGAAKAAGMTIEEFIRTHRAVAYYGDNLNGVYYTFVHTSTLNDVPEAVKALGG